MPTKIQTKAFIRKHKEIKVPLSQSRVAKLNRLVDEAVDKLDSKTHSNVINEWKHMKMKHDEPPKLSASEFSEILKKSAHGQKLLGAPKKKPKVKINVSSKNFTAVSKLGKPLTGKASDFAKVKSVKKSTTIQKKSTAPKKVNCYTKTGEKSGKQYTTCS